VLKLAHGGTKANVSTPGKMLRNHFDFLQEAGQFDFA
jgi:hypothetical protein